jgi:hypothetical protein
MYRFYVNDPVRFQKSIRMTIEHGHANNVANDYSSTAFWYQAEPHKAFRPLLPTAQRRPLVGDDPHDVAFQKMAAMRQKVFGLLVQAIFNEIDLPDDIEQLMKEDVHQDYFDRDYAKLDEDLALLDRRINEFAASLAAAAAAEAEAEDEGS